MSTAIGQLPFSTGLVLFARMMLVIAAVAGLAHVGFIALMLGIGATELAVFNVASVLLYLLTFRMTQSGHLIPAINLMLVEALAHAIVATCVLGWDAGFHLYLTVIIPVTMLAGVYSMRWRMIQSCAVALLLLVLDYWLRPRAPNRVLDADVLSYFYYSNMACAMLILGTVTFVYARLVTLAEDQLRQLALTDPLTQLHNRRAVMDIARREQAVLAREGGTLAVLLGDVDHFKRINDSLGHQVGDQVLQAVARVMRQNVREIDHVARWGGEEFLVLLPAVDEDEAQRIANRLREAVECIDWAATSDTLAVSITIGMCVMQTQDDLEQALASADQALYVGKAAGRNRVIVASVG